MLNLIDLVQNPLIITGILMALAVIVYFSLEYKHVIHKTKRERATIMVGWGLFLAVIALVALFTTSLNLLANSADLLPAELTKQQYTLNSADKLCRQLITEGSISREYAEGCEVIHYLYYGAYSILGIALLLLIWGFFKRTKAMKGDKAKKEKSVNEEQIIKEEKPDKNK